MEYQPQYAQERLENGLEVIVAGRPWARTLAMTLTFHVGWRMEGPREAGLTHLIEHLLLSGKNRERVGSLSRRGLEVNGHTNVDQIDFVVAGHRGLGDEALTFLRDIFHGISSDPETVEREKAIIRHELATEVETPLDTEMRRLTARLIGDREFGRKELSTVKLLKGYTAAEIEAFYRKYFVPNNARLLIVSPEPSDEILEKVRERFGGMPSGPLDAAWPEPEEVRLPPLVCVPDVGGYVLLHLLYAYRPLERFPVHAQLLLRDILGGGPYSMLYQDIREEGHLAYNVGSEFFGLRDCGLLNIHAIVPKKELVSTFRRILRIIGQVRDSGIEKDVFEEARERMLRGLDMVEDSAQELCDFLAQLPTSIPVESRTPQHFREQLQSLTREEADRTAGELFREARSVAAVFGPVGWLKRWRIRRLLRKASEGVKG